MQNNGRNGSNFVIQPNCWVMEIIEIVCRSKKCGVLKTQVANLLSWNVSNETLTEMWHLNLIELHYCDYRGSKTLALPIRMNLCQSNSNVSIYWIDMQLCALLKMNFQLLNHRINKVMPYVLGLCCFKINILLHSDGNIIMHRLFWTAVDWMDARQKTFKVNLSKYQIINRFCSLYSNITFPKIEL